MRVSSALFGLLAALVLVGNSRANDRVTTNRPDEVVGPSLHALYVLPPGGEDRHLDTNGAIAAGIAAFNGWFAAHTGTTFRIDTYEGVPDTTFVALKSINGNDIVDGLRGLGFDTPNTVYLVYVGGRSPRLDAGSPSTCGGWAVFPPPQWSFTFAFQYVGDSTDDPNGYCYPDPTTYEDRAMLDYVVHALGFPAPCAPHYNPFTGVLSDDPNDVITLGDGSVDLGHDDYFGPPGDDNLPVGCPNLADSPFLTWHPYARLVVGIRGRGDVAAFAPGHPPTFFCAPTPCDSALDAPAGTPVTLVRTPTPGWRFAGWSVAGCGRRGKCHLSLAHDVRVRATFVRASRSRG